MIHLVDQALERFLRAAVPLPESAIDVSFDTPDRTWGASVTRPTINMFLWDLKRNMPFSTAGVMERAGDAGRLERRPSTPVVDLHYFLTAWASDGRDEHQLLGDILRCVLGNGVLPPEHLPDELAGIGRVTMALAADNVRKPGDFSSLLDGRVKPGLEIELALPVDAFMWQEAGPETTAVELGVRRMPDTPADGDSIDEPPARPTRSRRGGLLVMEGRAPAADHPSKEG
jgi:hypothetical protein